MRRARTRRLVVALAASLALAGGACNSRLLRPPVTVLVDAGDQRVLAAIEDERVVYATSLFAYFPARLPIHARDSVKFELRSTGEPHSVALGKVVDDGLAAAERLGTGASITDIDSLPEMKKVPRVLPTIAAGEPPAINSSASRRCVLTREPRPDFAEGNGNGCLSRNLPDFDGTQTFYSSGVLAEGESFRIKLASDIRPGTYRYMCLVHGPAMSGSLQVRPADAPRPRAVTVKHQGSDAVKGLIQQLQNVAREASLRQEPGVVLAGAGPDGIVRGILAAYSPKVDRIRVGQTLTWKTFGVHSISFRSSRDAQKGMLLKDRDGTVRANEDSWRPVGEGTSWDGDGTLSSGILPSASSYSVTFAKDGRYEYRCLVHPSMTGVVEVA